MRKTTVVNCRTVDYYDVYICRPSRWGNPYVVGIDGDRNEVIEKYREWLEHHERLLKDLPSLRGKVLGCWCKPLPCHGDVLATLADALAEARP